MKKVILLIGNLTQANAAGFAKEFTAIGGKVDAIICLRPQNDLKYKIKRSLRFLKKLKPTLLTNSLKNVFAKSIKATYLNNTKKEWENAGENSWDLLNSDLNFLNFAAENKVPLHFAPFLSKQLISMVTKGESSLLLLYAGGFISDDLLKIDNVEFINSHMGEMPRYRGMNVLEWAVLEDQPPRVSVMIMNKAIDGGDVIFIHDIKLSGEKTIKDLRRRGYEECYKAMALAIHGYSKNSYARKPQDKGGKYYYRMHGTIRNMLAVKMRNQR
jgi:hypothetical protein